MMYHDVETTNDINDELRKLYFSAVDMIGSINNLLNLGIHPEEIEYRLKVRTGSATYLAEFIQTTIAHYVAERR